MTSYSDARHARMADAETRDPIIHPMGLRTEVPSGKRGRWARYNDPSTLVWATNVYGVMHGLTRNQANVYGAVQGLAGTGTRVTMRALGAELRIAGSSVYRAIVRLTALGFLAYQSNRGRNGGSVFLLRVAGDGLDWCRDGARDLLRRAWRASQERISRLRGNVALFHPGRETELYEHRYVTERNVAQHFREWTVEDFREAGLM